MIAEVEDILAAGTMPVSQVAVLYPRSAWMWDHASGGVYGPVGPHGTEDQGATAMDYMAVIAGLFRVIQQQNNIQVDFIDEECLTAEGLANHTALSESHVSHAIGASKPQCILHGPSAITHSTDRVCAWVPVVTEPDLPAEGLAAVLTWVKEAGGHLLTVAGAAAHDRYHQPSTQLQEATGIVEAPRQRLMINNAARLIPVANATGDLGDFAAFGPPTHLKLGTGLSQLTTRPGSGATTTAKFEPNGTAAIAHNPAVGKGSATHFAFMPCVHFNQIDPYKPQPHFDNITNFTDGSEAYVLRFLADAGVMPRVRVALSTGAARAPPQIETPLIISKDGACLTLLNWRESPVYGLEVSVVLDFDVQTVTAVQAMTTTNSELHFNSTAGASGTFTVTFIVASLEHSDFVMLARRTHP
jgi:hypothetical protein